MTNSSQKKEDDEEKYINGDSEKNYSKEFITSYFKWKTLDEQKKRGEELENITNNKHD